MALTNETITNDIDALADGAASVAGRKAKVSKGKDEKKTTTDASGSPRKAATGGRARSGAKAIAQPETKASVVLKKLNSPKGATIEMLMEATGWQAHSVRGFLSAVIKKKLGYALTNEIGKDGVRRYRTDAASAK